MKRFSVILATCLTVGIATAKDNEQATPPSSPGSTHEMGKPAASGKPQASEKKKAVGMSKKAYSRLLAAALRRHAPKSTQHQGGSVKVAFTVGASGRIVSHKIQYASDPALAATVGQVLASVQTPPPPGGSFSAVQEFTFH
jgi:outer membrane biosynthesis protein TonB